MRRWGKLFALAIMLAALSAPVTRASTVAGRFPPALAKAIVEVRALVNRSGNPLWPGLGKAPFGFLLVEQDREVLACEDRQPNGFVRAGTDPILNCALSIGPSSWRQPGLLAAMPVFGPPSTIVMGSPQTTGKTVPAWQATVVHEHFHQWQNALPNYFDRITALDLAKDDETGMWMLNYAFPYEKAEVKAAHAAAARALVAAIVAPRGQLAAKNKAYLAARLKFERAVTADDWRYFELQVWQEGAARWSELTIAERARNRAVAGHGRILRREVLDDLRSPDLGRDGRVAAYSYGAGEAMLLERTRPGWRKCYPGLLALGPLHHGSC